MNLDDCIDSELEVASETMNVKKMYPKVAGTYKRSPDLLNGRPFFENENNPKEFLDLNKYGIWWACGDRWCINVLNHKGQCVCSFYNMKNTTCISRIGDKSWILYNSTNQTWEYANDGLKLIAKKGT